MHSRRKVRTKYCFKINISMYLLRNKFGSVCVKEIYESIN